MKPGASVEYVRSGRPKPATVVAVPGSGPSGYKTLDLDVAGKRIDNVPHENDAGAHYWREHAAAEHAPDDAPLPVVPESKDEGRAAAGGAGTQE